MKKDVLPTFIVRLFQAYEGSMTEDLKPGLGNDNERKSPEKAHGIGAERRRYKEIVSVCSLSSVTAMHYSPTSISCFYLFIHFVQGSP